MSCVVNEQSCFYRDRIVPRLKTPVNRFICRVLTRKNVCDTDEKERGQTDPYQQELVSFYERTIVP